MPCNHSPTNLRVTQEARALRLGELPMSLTLAAPFVREYDKLLLQGLIKNLESCFAALVQSTATNRFSNKSILALALSP